MNSKGLLSIRCSSSIDDMKVADVARKDLYPLTLYGTSNHSIERLQPIFVVSLFKDACIELQQWCHCQRIHMIKFRGSSMAYQMLSRKSTLNFSPSLQVLSKEVDKTKPRLPWITRCCSSTFELLTCLVNLWRWWPFETLSSVRVPKSSSCTPLQCASIEVWVSRTSSEKHIEPMTGGNYWIWRTTACSLWMRYNSSLTSGSGVSWMRSCTNEHTGVWGLSWHQRTGATRVSIAQNMWCFEWKCQRTPSITGSTSTPSTLFQLMAILAWCLKIHKFWRWRQGQSLRHVIQASVICLIGT